MTMNTKHARFCYDNWLDTSMSSSSALSGYPASNLFHSLRGKLWKAAGAFEVSNANKNVYINGSTYSLATGTYQLAGLISAFNTATGKTLARNALGRFTITSGINCTLNLSNQTNAIWDVLGFLTTTDLTSTTFQGDERRYSTSEWVKIDMGLPQRPTFAAILPPSGEVFSAPLASIRLQGNNLDTWDSPPVSLNLEVSDAGGFLAPNDIQPCRFWRLYIVDKTNPVISAAVAYIGDSVVPEFTNLAIGFSRTREDQSVKLYSESGALYVDRRPKVTSIRGASMELVHGDDLEQVEQFFDDVGVEKPFFIVIDPSKAVSSSLSKMTHYVSISSDLSVTHVLRDYYNLSIDMREVL